MSEREAGADTAKICNEIGEIVGHEANSNSLEVGNAKAMREALLRCDAIAQLPEIREYVIVKDMRNFIKKALAAPPRNFDRYNTAEGAVFAFRKMCKENECSTCPFEDDRNYPFSCHFNWLYSEAENEETK